MKIACAVALMLVLAGCAEKAQIANPASVFCEEHGGKLEIRSAEDGSQSGFCVFSGAGECEEWAYYRSECAPSKQ